jgi:carboxyl-terminal processing protease
MNGMNKVMLLALLVTPLFGSSGPVAISPSWAGDPESQDSSGAAALRLYVEALDQISARAVFSPGDRTTMVQQTLSAYLVTHDPYSGLLTRDEFAAYRAIKSGTYAGVGAELERRHDGETVIYPFPGGPAERAGIKAGEQLLSIAGMPVKDKPLAVLAAKVSGTVGTVVALEVDTGNGTARHVDLTRAIVAQPALSMYTVDNARVIRLSSFTAATRSSAEALLTHWNPKMPVIIDLRGCGGGDFYAAVDTAMLFLDKGQPIVTVNRRSGTQRYASTADGLRLEQPVFLWQDEHTASAAELFIAALTDNGRATSIGRTSAGKGSRQDILPLSDGSALILTTGYLSTPDGAHFDGRGLTPQRPVVYGAGTAVYLQASGPKE